MSALVSSLRARYAKLTRRERLLVVATALGFVIGLGYLMLIEPALKQRALLERQISAQQKDRAALEQAVAGAGGEPGAALRAQLAALQTQLRATDREFGAMRNGLVQPQHMGALLQSLLSTHRGLQLLSLKSLPVSAVGESASGGAAKKADGADNASPPASAAPALTSAAPSTAASASTRDDGWLYRHGVEIRVQGSYADMLGYLQALESLPRRVYWGDVEVDARHYPASVMTVRLYTISLEKSWWVL